jgi:hypothetical protein
LKGKAQNSGIRIIFIYDKNMEQVYFIEIYYKGDKENEDRNRLQKWFEELSN